MFPELTKAVALVAAWMNSRLELMPQYDFGTEDFQVQTFAKVGDHWKALVVSNGMGGMHYKVSYSADSRTTVIEQFRKTDELVVHDDELIEREPDAEIDAEPGDSTDD